EIVTKTFEQLQIKLKNNAICFDLLSTNFTLNDFQQLYEYAFDVEFDKANFRKKIKNLPLVNLNVKQKNVKHRPANLYRFDHEKYKQMVEKENFNFKM
ncbi:MAG: NrtR DNA-binding winged helix domain-containing protein, partial [Crocinitomicaceae bacterium]